MPVYPREHTGIPTLDRSPWIFQCDKPRCYYTVSTKTEELAEREITSHICPKSKPARRHNAVSGIYEKLWDRMDEVVQALKDPDTAEDTKVGHRGQAVGLAYAIQLMNPVDFRDAVSVSREAIRRYKIQQGQLEYSPTPGYIPPTHLRQETKAKGWYKAEDGGATSDLKQALIKRVFTDQEVAAIKLAADSGFSLVQLQEMYKCTADDIKTLDITCRR